jgi:hypothetical protein
MRPTSVARFELLAYVSLLLGVLGVALTFENHVQQAGLFFVLAVQGITFAVLIVLIWLIARRRQNWARWVFAVLFVLGLPLSLPMVWASLMPITLSGVISVVQIALQVVGLIFVFSPQSRPWFQR